MCSDNECLVSNYIFSFISEKRQVFSVVSVCLWSGVESGSMSSPADIKVVTTAYSYLIKIHTIMDTEWYATCAIG